MKYIVFCLIIFPFTSLFAQDAIKGEEQMKVSAQEASEAFEAKEFPLAAKKYAEAFTFFSDYTLKKNEMVAWFKAGNCDSALAAGLLYLEKGENLSAMDYGDVKTVQVRCELLDAKKSLNSGRLEVCEAHLGNAEKIIDANAYRPVQGSEESKEIIEIRVQIKIIRGSKESKESKKVLESHETSYLGPILMGTGVIALGIGVSSLLVAESNEADLLCKENILIEGCEKSTGQISEEEYKKELSSIQTMNTIGWTATLLGLATSAVGTYFYLSDSKETSVNASVNPITQRFSVDFKTSF